MSYPIPGVDLDNLLPEDIETAQDEIQEDTTSMEEKMEQLLRSLNPVCPICEGTNVIELGGPDDFVEQACPHVIAEHKERDLQSALSEQKNGN